MVPLGRQAQAAFLQRGVPSLLHYNQGMVTTPQLRTMRRYAVAAGRIAASLVAVLFCKALNYLWPSKLRYARICTK